ncbi:MAG: RHS repeat-associated core domain-containing protein [Cyanophyceae cyanobacterium]
MPCETERGWVYCRNENQKRLTVMLPDDRTIVLDPGERFETENPCEMLSFLNSLPAEEKFQEQREGVVAAISEAAEQAGCAGGSDVNATPDAGTTDAGPPPSPDGDSGDAQGAPTVETGGTAGAPTHPEEGTGVPGTDADPPFQPQPGQPHTTHGGEESQQPIQGGDPVNLFRGAFYLEETDLEIPNGILPLALIRRYRSGSPNLGPFGWNWDHNHNVFLRELSTGNIARWNGRLHEDVFQHQGNDFEPPRGIFEQLQAVPGQPQTYEITATGGTVWRFERPAGWTDAERIPLVVVSDRHGNALRYTYNSDNQVAEVRDDGDRFLQFQYGNCGLLERVQDHTGRAVQYDHEAHYEHLACVRFPATSDHPSGITRIYHYARPDAMPELRHNIVRMMDGDGRVYLENEYEPDVASWSYARVVRQLYGSYEYLYRYTQLQWVPPKAEFVNIPAVRVEVMAPDRSVTTYTFNYRGDLLDHRQRLLKDGSFRVVNWTYDYDAQGNLSTITQPDGSQELRVYDHAHPDPRMRRNLLRRELTAAAGFPSPSRIVWRGAYESTFQLLQEERLEGGAITRYRYDFDLTPGPDNTGKLRAVIDPDVTLPDGTIQTGQTRFETDEHGAITAIITADGTRQELDYGVVGTDQGRLRQQRWDVGHLNVTENFEYSGAGYLTAVTDGTGAMRRLVVNAVGQVEHRLAPPIAGSTTKLIAHFDADGKVMAIERPRGQYDDAVIAGAHIVDRLERNVLGHIERMVMAANTASPREVRICPDYRGLPEQITHPDGAITRSVFDERGLLVSRLREGTDQTQTTVRRVYDLTGRMTQLIEGTTGDRITSYQYDGFGRLVTVNLPNGSTITYSWGNRDLLIQEELSGDPGDGSLRLLASKRYEYDERRRLLRSVERSFRDDPTTTIDLVTTYFYDAINRLERVVDHRGGITRYRYDNLGRLLQLTDPEGNEQHYGYDAVGHPTSIALHDVEPAGVAVRFWQMEYDERGRLVRSIEPDGTEIREEYDDRDLPIRRIEPDGIVRERQFGTLGELLQVTLDPAGLAIVNTWSYDPQNRPLTYTDPTGEVTRYVYDGIGRPIRTELPNGATAARVFGTDGRLQQEQLASGTRLEFSYDAAGRLMVLRSLGTVGATAISEHHFQYDGLDRLTRGTAGSLTVERRFDSRGRLIRETNHGLDLELVYNDLAGTVERHWSDGRRELLQTNLNGIGVRLTRTASGRLGSGGDELGTFVPSGERHFGTATLQGGLVVNAEYDHRKRLTGLYYATASTTLANLSYRYDARSRCRVEQVATMPTQLRYYQFDARDRLIEAAEGFAVEIADAAIQSEHDAAIAAVQAAATAATRRLTFDYDAADARTRYQETGLPERLYTYAPGHRILTAGTEAFTYHSDGARQSDATYTYTVDALGRTVEIRSDSSPVLQVTYDALGRPAILQEGGTSRTLSYFGNDVLQESEAGIPVRQFSLHPVMSGSLAVHLPGATYYIGHDARLNLIAAINLAGQPVEHYHYQPFGIPSLFDAAGNPLTTSAIGLSPIFGGMRYLPTTKLYLSLRRTMDPTHGVFLNTDPFGFVDSPNLYAYSAQDPVNLVDPTGELAFLGILAVAAVGAAVAGGLNAARQWIQIAEGSREEFSWGEFGLSTGIGAVAAPLLVVAPELAVPLAAYGVVGGIDEISEGNYATGTFDIATSLAPFGFKNVRASTAGRGSLIGQARGLGRSIPLQTRLGRFNIVGKNLRHFVPAFRGRRIGVGFSRSEPGAPEGHAAVVVENELGNPSFFEKNAQRLPDRSLAADFNTLEGVPEYYLPERLGQTRPFEYSDIRVSRTAAESALQYARQRIETSPPEPFDFQCANCSHFVSDVLGAAGFRGLGTGRGSGVYGNFINFAISRAMSYAAPLLAPTPDTPGHSSAEEAAGQKSAGDKK